MKQIYKTAVIGGKSAMIGHKHIGYKHDAGVANQRFKITALDDYLCQTQMLFDQQAEDCLCKRSNAVAMPFSDATLMQKGVDPETIEESITLSVNKNVDL